MADDSTGRLTIGYGRIDSGSTQGGPTATYEIVRLDGESGKDFASRVNAERRDALLLGKYKRFMPIATSFAAMSKYPGTHVGALVLGPGWEVRSSGWNGAPRGSDADVDYRSEKREVLLEWISHAEANAITNAARCGTALEGCTLICTHAPCMNCAKLIVQAGITTVVFNKPDGVFMERWKTEFERALSLFAEVGVVVVEL